MNILQICIRVPDPPGDGGAIAMRAIGTSLMEAGAKVKILAFNTRKHFVEDSRMDPDFKQKFSLESVFLDASIKVWPAFKNLFGSDSYNIQRFISPHFKSKLESIFKKDSYDIVQLESVYLAPYLDTIRKNSSAKIVLRAHNIEYLIWQRMADASKNRFMKWYLRLLAKRLKAFEIRMINRYDAILPITREDEKILRLDGCVLPIQVIPLGLNIQKYKTEVSENVSFKLFHLGSMDWLPNQEAINWFLQNVWPEVHQQNPLVTLCLAGKNMPDSIKRKKQQGLEVDDFIADAIKYMDDKTVMVVPLLSGSGMRVKILEGMAMSKTIISTRIGAEGIDCSHLENIILADTPEEFIFWIRECSTNKALCERIGEAACKLVATKYDNKAIGENLYHFYQQNIKR